MTTYDLNKWVAGDLAERRPAWMRVAYAAPLALAPILFLLDINDYFRFAALEWLEPVMMLGVILGFFMSLGSPFMRHSWRPFRQSGEPLDEREQAIVAGAHARSFHLLLAAVLGGFLYVWLAAKSGWWLPRSGDDVDALFRLFIFTAPILPVVIAEWTTPPLAPGREED